MPAEPRRVQGPDGTLHIFPADATDEEVRAALGGDQPITPESPPRSMLDTAKDVGTGMVKGAAHTAEDLGSLVQMIPGAGAATNAIGNAVGGAAGKLLYGTATPPVSNDAAMKSARDQTAYTNTPQHVGGALEALMELAVPAVKGAQAVPTAAKAGQKFQSVMAAAKDIPIDVNGPGQVALRIHQLAERGGSMPMAVRKFLARVTDPKGADMTYQEARDFASNISRLSVNEYQRMSPVVAREVATMRVALNEAVAGAAKQAGKLDEYRSAMREYAQAMKIRDGIAAVAEGAKKAAPYATAAGAGYWLTSHLKRMLGGEE